MLPAHGGASFSCEDIRMIEPSANVVSVAWKVVVAALAIGARLALDRLSFRGYSRRTRPRGR
jgi:hypothetical protein